MNTLRSGLIKRIHVDRRIMAMNRKTGGDNPPITIQTSKGSIKAHCAQIQGPSRTVHAGAARGVKPLSCGARVWVETTAEVLYL